MSDVVLNELRKGTYLDSVALMRLSRRIAAMPGVVEAALKSSPKPACLQRLRHPLAAMI